MHPDEILNELRRVRTLLEISYVKIAAMQVHTTDEQWEELRLHIWEAYQVSLEMLDEAEPVDDDDETRHVHHAGGPARDSSGRFVEHPDDGHEHDED